MLVLTWLPDREACRTTTPARFRPMLVLQGEAAEGCWRVAEDGYVDLQYETAVRVGEITAWQDAGVAYRPERFQPWRNTGHRPCLHADAQRFPPLRFATDNAQLDPRHLSMIRAGSSSSEAASAAP